MSFELLSKAFEDYEKMVCKPINYKKVRPDHVFDEDKSVKWNREQVEINNAKFEEEVKQRNTEKNKVRDNLLNETYKLMQEYIGKKKITIESCKVLWNFINERNNISYSCVVRYHLEDYCLFMLELLDNNTPKETTTKKATTTKKSTPKATTTK